MLSEKQILVSEFQGIKSFTQKGRKWAWPMVKTFIVCVSGSGKREPQYSCELQMAASGVEAVCQMVWKIWPLSRANTSSCNTLSFLPHQRCKVLSSLFTLWTRSCLPACLYGKAAADAFILREGEMSSEVIYHSWTTHILPWIQGILKILDSSFLLEYIYLILGICSYCLNIQ